MPKFKRMLLVEDDARDVELTLDALEESNLANEVDAEVDVDPGLPLDLQSQQAFYRVARESVRNIAKHAGASAVAITLHREGNDVVLTVRDDGRGFDPSSVPTSALATGHGIENMHERAKRLGGELRIVSTEGRGTRVEVRLG